VVQNTGLKPFSARKQAVIHQGKSRGFILKLVKNTREKLVLPRKIFARGMHGKEFFLFPSEREKPPLSTRNFRFGRAAPRQQDQTLKRYDSAYSQNLPQLVVSILNNIIRFRAVRGRIASVFL
jgi:hypothetical protein